MQETHTLFHVMYYMFHFICYTTLMLTKWKNFISLSLAIILIIIGIIGLILPVIPGIIFVIAGAVIIDRIYPELKNHRHIFPHLDKIKKWLKSFSKK